jgi:hypothetical protein
LKAALAVQYNQWAERTLAHFPVINGWIAR